MPVTWGQLRQHDTPTISVRRALEAIWRQTRMTAETDSLFRAGLLLARALCAPRAAGEWLIFLDTIAQKHSLGRPRLDCIEKPLLNYAVHRLSVWQRVSFLQRHYGFVAASAPSLLSVCWFGAVADLGLLRGKRGEKYCLTLSSAGYCHKEGEFSLTLSDAADGLELAKLTFVIIGEQGVRTPIILIGGLQGPSSHCGPQTKARIVQATRALSGLRPKMVVFIAASAFARSIGSDRILAVSKKTHSINADAWWQRRRMYADYDAFWCERGGTPDVLGYRLSANSPPKPPCNRRNEQRARVAAMAEFFFANSLNVQLDPNRFRSALNPGIAAANSGR